MDSKKIHENRLFKLLGITNRDKLKQIAGELGIKINELEFLNNNRLYPYGEYLEKILEYANCSELELKIRLGILDENIIEWISENPDIIIQNIFREDSSLPQNQNPLLKYETDLGQLFQGDCIELMRKIPSNSIDCIFADPPFNLNKDYESGIDDNLSEQRYIQWTEEWILECIRILSPGGSLFIYNIPYWATQTANILNKYLTFKHWISISMKGTMPITNRLHPSHYALLYYVKGPSPKVFNQQRIPISTCRHCGGEIHDYGGKKKMLNPRGLSISDVWTDINPVRHKKFKNRTANELSIKLLFRVISMATNKGDVIFDPFGGSGTTFAVAEFLNRRWIGIELGEVNTIINRLALKTDEENLKKMELESNVLFTQDQVKKRKKNGFWTYEILNTD